MEERILDLCFASPSAGEDIQNSMHVRHALCHWATPLGSCYTIFIYTLTHILTRMHTCAHMYLPNKVHK